MCISLVNSEDFLNIGSVKSILNENGIVEIYYSAYSADSDFSDTVKYNFCPYCGESIKNIITKYTNSKNEKIKLLQALEDIKKKNELDKIVILNKEKLNKCENEVSKGNYNVYSFNNTKHIAFNKNHLKTILTISNKELKNYILIERYTNNKKMKNI